MPFPGRAEPPRIDPQRPKFRLVSPPFVKGKFTMKRLLSFMFTAALLAGIAGVAGATIYPPGPGGTCPDTMTINNLQNAILACHPAAGDTVYGVRGVVVAVDSIAGAF